MSTEIHKDIYKCKKQSGMHFLTNSKGIKNMYILLTIV